jgi:gliding motility-associated-like protein
MIRIIFSIFLLFLTSSVFGQLPITFGPGSHNQTFNTCNGFIIDSGGQGGSGYSNNEDIVITVCPDNPGDYISVVFNLFNLSLEDDNPAPNQTNVDYMFVYDGTSTAANTLGNYSGTQLQGVVIQSTPQNATGCLTFRFVSNTIGTGMFSASVLCETPCNNPVAGGIVLNGITQDSIHVCIGEEVQFQNQGSFAQPGFQLLNYTWDFMDGNEASGQNVSHTYTVPGHYRVQLFVQDNNPDNVCTNTNLVDIQVLVATIPSFEGFQGDTTLCLGEFLNVVAFPNDYEVTWNGFSGYESIDDGCLPDTQLGVAQNIEMIQTGFAAGTTITDISQIQSICLEMEHSFMGDLVIYLTCPNGQSVMMHQQGGGGTNLGVPNQADNVDCDDPSTQGEPFNYCFTPTAPQTWVQWVNSQGGFGLTLPEGDYQTVEPLSSLVGCPTNGVWTLTVVDNWAADDGTLFSFGLTLDPSLYPDLVQFTPQIGLGADSSYWTFPAIFASNLSPDGNSMTITPTAPGQYTYTFNVTNNFGCFHDSSFVLTVNPNPMPFAGNDTVICGGNPLQLNGIINGSGGAGSPCAYVLNLTDSFGDGWNGNNLLVTVNGVQTSYTVPSGSQSNFTVNIPHGAAVTIQFQNSGNWVNECEFVVLDPTGNVVTQQGQNGATPNTNPFNFTADCFGGFEFLWTPSANLNNATIPNPIGEFYSPTQLTLTIHPTGHPLCVTSDQINITLSETANPGQDSTITLCTGSAPLSLFPFLGAGASPNGTWFNTANQPFVMPFNPATMPAGVYMYEVDSLGCIARAYITVQLIDATIDNIIVTNASCNSIPTGSAEVFASNFLTYSINGSPQQTATNPFIIPNLLAGTYTVEIFGAQGCTSSETFTITEPAPLQIPFLTPDALICFGDSITLNAIGAGGSSPYTFTWNLNNNTVGNGAEISVLPPFSSNTYCVTLSEACGSPSVTECMLVGNPENIIPLLTPDTTRGCFPLSLTFNNTTNSTEIATTFISFGDGDTITLVGNASIDHIYQNPGVYSVSVVITSIYGCVYTNTFNGMITVHGNPTAQFNMLPQTVSSFDPTVHLVDVSSPNIASYYWFVPDGNPQTSISSEFTTTFPQEVEGEYPVYLYVVDQNGCIDSVLHYVNVINDILFYAPNTFTPDGDEFNQTWEIHLTGIDEYSVDLRIYNRWGQLIWENHDKNVGWDGTYNGQLVQTGIYTWKLKVSDKQNDGVYEFDGHVNVMR